MPAGSQGANYTNFPYGITVDGLYPVLNAADGKAVFGTVVVPSGAAGTAFTPAGLSAITFAGAATYGDLGAGVGFSNVRASWSGSVLTLLGVTASGTASTANGTATYYAYGS